MFSEDYMFIPVLLYTLAWTCGKLVIRQTQLSYSVSVHVIRHVQR